MEKRCKDNEMVKSKTVILWGRDDLISWTVELFLTMEKEREVIRISDEQSIEVLFQEVEKVNPQVVIIHQGDYASDSPFPMQLLRDHPGLKVITVCMENNAIEVYSRQKVYLEEIADLLSAVDD